MLSGMREFEAVIGEPPDRWAHVFTDKKPGWVTGSLSHSDSKFLFCAALSAGVSEVIEIGTASGFSTAILCHALNFAREAGVIASDFQVISYDNSPNIYFDPSKPVGDAAREVLPPGLLDHVVFRHPFYARNLQDFHGADTVGFLFIDANHNHPWPTLDLFAALDVLRPGATVLLHDINLPVIHDAKFPSWGAKYLFDGLNLPKDTPTDVNLPNIGGVTIPARKDRLRAQLREILYAHVWQQKVSDEYLAGIGLVP
jgi:predicted O-methyltransferase YrrM